MEDTAQLDLESLAQKDTWTIDDVNGIVDAIASGEASSDVMHEVIHQMEEETTDPKGASAVKIGMGRYLLSQFQEALDVLTKGTDNKDRRWIQAKCYKQLNQFDQAVEDFQRAAERGWDGEAPQFAIVECQALGGKLEDAEKGLKKIKSTDCADYHYLEGLIADLKGFFEDAAASYEKALELDDNHADAKFRLAYFCDLHGEDEEALDLYEECVAMAPTHSGALLNLAVLQEDLGDYEQAAKNLRRILAQNPRHARARLFLKDVEASKSMYFDEDQAKRIAKRNAVLDIPVTDFELSVRARNCLKKMNIRCLGDLVRTTEQELLSYKNFGETSLREIKEMVRAKGLQLGQGVEQEPNAFGGAYTSADQQLAANEGVQATPISRVEFSVRARRALEELGASTLGELASKTEAELLACRNFGQSSLNEIRQRLSEYGLRLREL